MRTIGIDIGTTTLTIVLLEPATRQIIEVKTIPNPGAMDSKFTFERIQDPEEILKACRNLLHEISVIHSLEQVKGIGVTGQMHGVLYLDAHGNLVSPLYTWQDERGNQPIGEGENQSGGLSVAGAASQKTGYPLASGFGGITHYYNVIHGLVSQEAVCFCTIADFVGMKLSGKSKPLLHPSMAASLGLYDLKKKCFDQEAIEKLELDHRFFPEISGDECWIGSTKEGIPVSVALGDNQASFLGATEGMLGDGVDSKGQEKTSKANKRTILLNIGTGSQISIYSEEVGRAKGGEYRPYLKGSFLWAGSPLCGGYSYHLLKNFFEKTLELFGAVPMKDLYERMNQAGRALYNQHEAAKRIDCSKAADERRDKTCEVNAFKVDTRFRGTRTNPERRGSITHISEEELQPEHFVLGFLKGIAGELYEYYQDFLYSESSSMGSSSMDSSFRNSSSMNSFTTSNSIILVGSGNGLGKNPLLRRICSELFGEEMQMSSLSEEAACGSAFLAGRLCQEEEGDL